MQSNKNRARQHTSDAGQFRDINLHKNLQNSDGVQGRRGNRQSVDYLVPISQGFQGVNNGPEARTIVVQAKPRGLLRPQSVDANEEINGMQVELQAKNALGTPNVLKTMQGNRNKKQITEIGQKQFGASLQLHVQQLPNLTQGQRNMVVANTQKLPASQGLARYPSHSKIQEPDFQVFQGNESQKLRIAMPQSKNAAIQYWKQKDAQTTKGKFLETGNFKNSLDPQEAKQNHQRRYVQAKSHFEQKQLDRKANFFANLGNKETTQQKLTLNTDKGKPPSQEVQRPKMPSTIPENLVIFTDMNVDHHDFDIKNRRVIQDQLQANTTKHRPQNSMHLISDPRMETIQTLAQASKRSNDMPLAQTQKIRQNQQRPISGASSNFLAAQQAQMIESQLRSVELLKSKASAKRQESRETLWEQELSRRHADLQQENDIAELDGFSVDKNNQVGAYCKQLMQTRPTTALIGNADTDDTLPYPELFDRSERTFAATFAKYGNLSYFTPVQRIGNYMEYQQRLTKRHLMDLIAYQKTSKSTVKVEDHEFGKTNHDYLDHCLFHGYMLNEEANNTMINTIMDFTIPEVTVQNYRQRVMPKQAYNPCSARSSMRLDIEKIWSKSLLKQLSLSIMRMLKYIDNLDCIRDEELSKFKSEWILHALELIPLFLQKNYKNQIQQLYQEVQLTYKRSMKQAIMDYILRSPDERRRLHILMLPHQVITAAERQVQNGGYSIGIYQGTHHRKIAAENEIKFRLITNNIVVSSIQSWWQEFRNLKLIDFQNFQAVVQERNLQQSLLQQTSGELFEPEISSTLDIDNFLSFQEAVLEKTKAVMKHIWHRGAVLIIKKFKCLKTKEQHKSLYPGHAAKSRWSYSGYMTEPIDYGFEFESYMHESTENFMESVINYSYNGGNTPDQEFTPYQAYAFRTASAHKNVDLKMFRTENEQKLSAVVQDLMDSTELKDLYDIRQSPAYVSFVQIIGSFINLEENGYEGLAKDYKRELKYAAGNLMAIQLRQMVQSSVEMFCNFFVGFKTYEDLRSSMPSFKPMRIIVPMLTKFTTDKDRMQKQLEEEIEKMDKKLIKDSSINVALQAQLEKRKQASTSQNSEYDAMSVYNMSKDKQILKLPDFIHYQDYANPIFHLELLLGSMQEPSELKNDRDLLKLTQNLEFNKSDQQILENFDAFFYDLVTSFNDFSRPEFCKVRLFNKRELENQKETDHTRKLQLEQQRKQRHREYLNIPKESATIREAKNKQIFHYSVSPLITPPTLDFDKMLYSGNFDNPFGYEKYMGRIKVEEAIDLAEKRLLPFEHNEGETLFTKESVKRQFNVAHAKEGFFKTKRDKIMDILRDHLRETKRIHELYEQFKPIIQGRMQEKVMAFVKSADNVLSQNVEYAAFLAELRNYKNLALQLPQRVAFPLFDVGLRIANKEIINRIDNFIFTILSSYEEALRENTQELCTQYEQIYEKIAKNVETAEEVVAMENYKSRLLMDMATLQRKLTFNRKCVYFLLTHNCHDQVFMEPKKDAGTIVEGECKKLVNELLGWPSRLNNFMDQCDERHGDQRLLIEKRILSKKAELDKSVKEFYPILKRVFTIQSINGFRKTMDFIKESKTNLDLLEDLKQQILLEETLLFGYKSEFNGLLSIQRQFEPYYELWMKIDAIIQKRQELQESNLRDIDAEEVEKMAKESMRTMVKLQKQFGTSNSAASTILSLMSNELKKINELKPIIDVMCSKSLKDRHWQQIKLITGSSNDHLKDLTLREVLMLSVHDEENLKLLKENIDKAKKQDRLENILAGMQKEWSSVCFELKTFKDTEIPILVGTNIEIMQNMLDDHVTQSQLVKTNPDVEPIIAQASEWEHTMIYTQDILEIWLRVQTNYLFLVPIFNAGGIQEEVKNLLDQDSFKLIEVSWKKIMNELKVKNRVLDLEKEFPSLLEDLRYQDERLQKIQLSLNAYLESKREYFPRFYFLPNEDLIEILGDSQKPKRIQKHLKKCFEGISEITFRDQMVAGKPTEQIFQLESPEGEKVQLLQPINPHQFNGMVEQWLSLLEHQMKFSVQKVISDALKDYPSSQDNFFSGNPPQSESRGLSTTIRKYNSDLAEWLSRWQSQVLIVVQQIMWTSNVEAALQSVDSFKQLVNLFHSRQNQLVLIVNMVRDKLPNLMRMTLSSMIVIEVHARDIVENLARQKVRSIDDFNWINNLRYYYDKQNDSVQVSMIMTDLTYNNEFLGNTGRLVITPLTDRCYRTLMSALALNLGGAPEGPAGTGKTETTKDLAKAVAVYCKVFNCSEGLNAAFMSKFFKGLASGGTWSCFDEFNRIELEVLSVIAQQILEIQRAKSARVIEFIFEDAQIKLQTNCNIFITMNPDYTGRSALPDNLKALFRPVAMMIPEYSMISEISLYSFGFFQSRNLAKKIVQTYRLCSEQLSMQYHYDYGMRAVKAVLNTAKNLKYQQTKKQSQVQTASHSSSFSESEVPKQNPESQPREFNEESEESIILRSIRDVNLPKFLAEDIPLFEGIIHDLFQGQDFPLTDYPQLRNCLNKAVSELELQSSVLFTEKVFQLYDMIKCRHGLMIVGPANSGKSAVHTSLRKALNYVVVEEPSFEEIETESYVINPKSVTIEQLYGSYEPISQEFQDGIIGSVFRRCAYKNTKGKRQWIIFDGPVDANWIENMNTVLDDNKRLCLNNGEVIQMTELMNMIFETHDLSFASPATVSRLGMVFCPNETYGGWLSLLQSWLSSFEKEVKLTGIPSISPQEITDRILNLFKLIYAPLLAGVLSSCKLIIPVSDTQITASMLKIMGILTSQTSFVERIHDKETKVDEIFQRIDMIFQFAIIWSLGSITDDAGQKNFQKRYDAKIKENFKVGQNRQFRIEKQSMINDLSQPVHNFKIEDLVWTSWKDLANRPENNPELYDETPFNEIIITTTENLKHAHMLNLLIKHGKPTVLIGGTGTGKTIAVNRFLRTLEPSQYDSTIICFSAKSSANITQETIQSKLEKRNRRLLGPPANKKFVIFVDDLNMPTVEKNGAQPPIELLRQWLDQSSWYDYTEKDNILKKIENIVLVAAMCPHDGGKNLVSPRFARHFNIISCPQFDDSVLIRIYGKIVDWHINKEKIRGTNSARVLKGIVEATIDIFNFIQINLKPTPAKSHYLFNLRDISRVIQGIHMMRTFQHSKVDKMVRLWVHEIARVFTDRLSSEKDQLKVYQQLEVSCRIHIKENLMISLKDCMTVSHKENGDSIEKCYDIMTEQIKFSDLIDSSRNANQREYDEIAKIKYNELVEKLYQTLRGFNVVSKKPMDLVLFDFAINHILRITRVLKISKGNILLIGLGGSGRTSLSILSAYLMEQDIFQPKQSKNYKYDDWVQELKELMLKAGHGSQNCAFLLNDQDMKHSYVLTDVNNLINQYEIPGIFGKDDKIAICETSRINARSEGRHDLYHSTNQNHLMDFFTKKIEKNLHVILCMSPTGSTLQERIRMYPSLVNCCTINWFTDWPQEALYAVAQKYLDEATPFKPELKTQIRRVCYLFHSESQEMSKNYFKLLKRQVYITPTTYLDLMEIFLDLLEKQKNKLYDRKVSYETGVEKIAQTQEEVAKMQVELNEKQPQLEEMQIQASILEKEIAKESDEVVEPQKKIIQDEEQRAHKIAMEAESTKIDCDNELLKALPILNQAMAALDTIKPKDINEIKALQKPPMAIQTTLHAVCVMLDRKVEKTPKKDNPKVMEDNWWFTAQKFMNEKNFIDCLINFDKDNIPEHVIEKIRTQFLNDPEFKPQRVSKASLAAKGLCEWVIKLEQYHSIVVFIRPKKQALADSKALYTQAAVQLTLKQEELRKVVHNYEGLQLRLRQVADHKKKLFEDIKDVEVRLYRAKLLMEGLGGEEERWKQSLNQAKLDLRTVIPDMLLASVIIAYLGPFTQQFRATAIQEWIKTMNSYSLQLSPNFSLERVLGEQIVIKQWQKTGLPNDAFSIENGLIMTNARKWPLMIDPQGQANRWIKNMENKLAQEANYVAKLFVVKPQDTDFGQKFEQALRMGLAVVLESVGEQVDPLLDPVLLKQIFKIGGIKQIRFGEEVIDYADEFRLYMTTKLENPHYLPELTTKVTIINFMITNEILCDQLLNLVVKMEDEALEDECVKLITAQYENNRQMQEIEQTILTVLKQSQGNILDDEKAINVLRASQQLSEEIKKKQADAIKTEVVVQTARKLYYPIARHASVLFFIVQKLSQVDVMYQYSLSWFIQLFTSSVSNSKNEPPKSDAPPKSHRPSSPHDERVEQLIDHFTFSLYSNVCRSIFEKDKLLFSFLLTAQIRLLQSRITSIQYQLLISPMTGLEGITKMQNPCPDWLPHQTWLKFCYCQNQDPLFDGLIKYFEKHQEQWKELFDCEIVDDDLFPPFETSFYKEYPLIMKLIIVKCIRPDKLPEAMQNYVFREMGQHFLSPPIFDIEQSYNDSNNSTPLIFILPGTDPLQQLSQFAYIKKKQDTMKVISLGQGQGPKAEKNIAEARKHGSWVLLQNCHLYPSWMGRLDQICEQMEQKQATPSQQTHPSFRLWLTSYPTVDFPSTILQNGIKMTNEPPIGLKSNMIGSYKDSPLNDSHFFEQSKNPAVFKKLAFGLAMFHAILLQRRNFGSLGFNIKYEFTVSDLQISMRQLFHFIESYQKVPFKALKYLIGECNYGGRVTSLQDNRILSALLEDFLDDKVLEQGYSYFPQDRSQAYVLPQGDNPYYTYIDKINGMPITERPQLFGFHQNADITKNLGQAKILLEAILQIGEVEGAHANHDEHEDGQQTTRSIKSIMSANAMKRVQSILAVNSEEHIAKACQTILDKLPKSQFDVYLIAAAFPIIRENSMNTVLMQEIMRFNKLYNLIVKSIDQILQAQSGDILMTDELATAAEQIFKGQVPDIWMRISYPSLKSLSGYVIDLTIRMAMFQKWIMFNKPPEVLWLSGFYFTQSFLTAILQNFARKYHIEIDLLEFEFRFTEKLDPTNHETEVFQIDQARRQGFDLTVPEDGALISGLFFEGARWDMKQKCICEQSPKQLFTKAPIIWLLPVVIKSEDPTSLAIETASNLASTERPIVGGHFSTKADLRMLKTNMNSMPYDKNFQSEVMSQANNIISETKTDRALTSPGNDNAPPVIAKDERITYKCPLYKTVDRRGALSTTGHSTNFIFYIDTPIQPLNLDEMPRKKQSKQMMRRSPTVLLAESEPHNMNFQHWVKRGAALFCSLPN